MMGAVAWLRCQMDPACAYPAIDVVAGTPACAMCRQAAAHPESYARHPALVFRRIEPVPVRRRYVAADRAATGNRAATANRAATEAKRRERLLCLICASPCGPLGLCRAHVDGWRKHNAAHRLDRITPAQYAARRAACSN